MNELEQQHLNTVASVCDPDTAMRRAKLKELELTMLGGDGELLDLPVKHVFHNYTYMRELFIPKGVMLVGRIHLFDHIEILVSGDITHSTDTEAPRRVAGYTVSKGMAGKQRAIYAHEDSIFMTVHSADEREPDEMYDHLTCGSFEEYEAFHCALSNITASALALEVIE